MAETTSTLRPHLSCSHFLIRFAFRVNASRGVSSATRCETKHRPRRGWLATQAKEIQQANELYCRGRAKRRERLESLSALNPDLSKALDMKECMLEIQAVSLRRLAAEENQLKGFAAGPKPLNPDFDRRIKLEEAIKPLRY